MYIGNINGQLRYSFILQLIICRKQRTSYLQISWTIYFRRLFSSCEFHKLAGMEKDVQDNVLELAIPIENDLQIIITEEDNQEILFETVQKHVIDSSCSNSQTPPAD